METPKGVSFLVAVGFCVLSLAHVGGADPLTEGLPVPRDIAVSYSVSPLDELSAASSSRVTADELAAGGGEAGAPTGAAAGEAEGVAAAADEALEIPQLPVGPSDDGLLNKEGKIIEEETLPPIFKSISSASTNRGDIEWVQLVTERQRLTLTAKIIGKTNPRPPIRFMHDTLNLPRSYSSDTNDEGSSTSGSGSRDRNSRERSSNGSNSSGRSSSGSSSNSSSKSSDKPAAPEATADTAAAETPEGAEVPLFSYIKTQRQGTTRRRLEAPSQVQLVVEVEEMQQQSPVLYAFRWGKPATWADYDYLLEAYEAGVYVLHLQEPLHFPAHVSPRLHAQASSSTVSPLLPRIRKRAPDEDFSASRAPGFRRVDGGQGCMAPGGPWRQEDNMALGGDPLTRSSSVPLYYTIQFAPDRGAITAEPLKANSYVQHIICLVFGGPPLLQLFPQASNRLLQMPLHQEPLLLPQGDNAAHSHTTGIKEGVSKGDAEDGIPEEIQAEETVEEALEVSRQRRSGLACTRVSELPWVQGEAHSYAGSSSAKGKGQGLPLASPEGLLLHSKQHDKLNAGGTAELRRRQVSPVSAREDCSLPYSDFVFYTDPLLFSSKPFHVPQTPETYTRALFPTWRRANAEAPLKAPHQTDEDPLEETPPASPSGSSVYCNNRDTSRGSCTSRRGALSLVEGDNSARQLRLAPSVTFGWRQLVLHSGSERPPKGDSPPSLPNEASLMDLLETGQSPCALLQFRGMEGSEDPHAGPPPAASVSSVSSCSAFQGAAREGVLTAEELASPAGVSWVLPRTLLPLEMQRASGAVVYRLRLLQTVPRVFSSPPQQPALHDRDLQHHLKLPNCCHEGNQMQQQQRGQEERQEGHQQHHEQKRQEEKQQLEKQKEEQQQQKGRRLEELQQQTQQQTQQGTLWVLEQALEVHEPGFGEWRLGMRRLSSGFLRGNPSKEGAPSTSDVVTIFALQRSCKSVLTEASSRCLLQLSSPPCALRRHNIHSGGFLSKLLYKAKGGETDPSSEAVAVPGSEFLQGSQTDKAEIEAGTSTAATTTAAAPPTTTTAPTAKTTTKTTITAVEEADQLPIPEQSIRKPDGDCVWCNTAILPFTSSSFFRPNLLQVSTTVGAPSLIQPGPSSSSPTRPTAAEARRLGAAAQETPLRESKNDAATPQWRPVGPPSFTALSLTPHTASGGRHLSVNVDMSPFVFSKNRRCAPLLSAMHPQAHDDGQAKEEEQYKQLLLFRSRPLYFYSLALVVTRDAVTPQPKLWWVGLKRGLAAAATNKANQRTPKRHALLRLPIFCEAETEDDDDQLFGGLSGGPLFQKTAGKTRAASLGGHPWRVEAQLLPPDFNFLPTTYLLQWQLLETEETPDAALFSAEAETPTTYMEEIVPDVSDADLRLHLRASSDVTRLCSEPCPEFGSCAITDRVDGFAVLGCRCAYGFGGATCGAEVMSPWLRTLAQALLVLSNLAMLPSALLCLRLAVRHLNLPGNPNACARCKAKRLHDMDMHANADGPSHAHCLLYALRAAAYLNAFLWSSLYHSCVDGLARLPLGVPLLQRLDYLSSYFALVVTAVAFSAVGSAAVELVGLSVLLMLLTCRVLPETFEPLDVACFVCVCVALPLVSLALKASLLWNRQKAVQTLQLQLQEDLQHWQPQDLKWLDSPSGGGPKEKEIVPSASEELHAEQQQQHCELQQLLTHKMTEAREKICLQSLGQAVALLEVAGRCRIELCCSGCCCSTCSSKRPYNYTQAALCCLKSASTAFLQHPGSSESDIQRTNSNLKTVDKNSASWLTCLALVLTDTAPRLEFLALGILLATLGAGCFSVGELSAHYWLLHSCWHVSIQLSTCCILLSLLSHPLLAHLRDPPTPSSAFECSTPARSLSEAVVSGDHHLHGGSVQTADTSNAHSPLAEGFWRVLNHSQMHLLALQAQAHTPYPHPIQTPRQTGPERGTETASMQQLHREGDTREVSLYPQAGLESLLGVLAPHANAQQLLQTFTRLLVLQYSAHKRHCREESNNTKGQRGIEEHTQPSPTYGDEDIVRVGTASALSPQTASPQTAQLTSPTSSVGSASSAGSACGSEWTESGCLWCIARRVLTEENLLKLYYERVKWTCRLRLRPTFSCLLFPRWVWQPTETDRRNNQRHLPIPHTDVLLYS